VQEDILRPGDQHFCQFHKVFEVFKLVEPVKKPEDESPMEVAAVSIEALKREIWLQHQPVEEESDEEKEAKVRGGRGRKGKSHGRERGGLHSDAHIYSEYRRTAVRS